MTDKLVLAVPSKGRLEENVAALFDKAGIGLKRDGARGYTGAVKSIPILMCNMSRLLKLPRVWPTARCISALPARICCAKKLRIWTASCSLSCRLGFSHADVVVAVPDGWVDVTTMFDLAEVAADFRSQHGKRLRVATKYGQLAGDFFARHHVADYEWVSSLARPKQRPIPAPPKPLSISPRPAQRWWPTNCAFPMTG